NDLLDRLAADDRLPMDRADLDALLADRLSFTGDASRQIQALVAAVDAIAAKHPAAAAYAPGAIL
ncbi:MAG: adenylosuccinate lyase, partial [Nakamurella sp.]